MNSYPYWGVSRALDVPYGVVLAYVDAWETGMGRTRPLTTWEKRAVHFFMAHPAFRIIVQDVIHTEKSDQAARAETVPA